MSARVNPGDTVSPEYVCILDDAQNTRLAKVSKGWVRVDENNVAQTLTSHTPMDAASAAPRVKDGVPPCESAIITNVMHGGFRVQHVEGMTHYGPHPLCIVKHGASWRFYHANHAGEYGEKDCLDRKFNDVSGVLMQQNRHPPR